MLRTDGLGASRRALTFAVQFLLPWVACVADDEAPSSAAGGSTGYESCSGERPGSCPEWLTQFDADTLARFEQIALGTLTPRSDKDRQELKEWEAYLEVRFQLSATEWLNLHRLLRPVEELELHGWLELLGQSTDELEEPLTTETTLTAAEMHDYQQNLSLGARDLERRASDLRRAVEAEAEERGRILAESPHGACSALLPPITSAAYEQLNEEHRLRLGAWRNRARASYVLWVINLLNDRGLHTYPVAVAASPQAHELVDALEAWRSSNG